MVFSSSLKLNSLLPYAATFSLPEYIVHGMHWLTICLYLLKRSVWMDANNGANVYEYCRELVSKNNLSFLHYSSHNSHLLRYGRPDPTNIFIDFYIYVSVFDDFKNFYEQVKGLFQNVLLFVKLGTVVVLPNNVVGDDGKCRYIVVFTFLFKENDTDYSLLSDDSNLLGLPIETDIAHLRQVPTFFDPNKIITVHANSLTEMQNYKFGNTKYRFPVASEPVQQTLAAYLKPDTFE